MTGACKIDSIAERIISVLDEAGKCLPSLDVLENAGACSKFVGRLALAVLVREGIVERVPDYGARRMCFRKRTC